MHKLKPELQFINKKEINLNGIKGIILMGDTGCTGFNEESKRVLRKILEKDTDLFFILGDLVYSGAKEEFNEVIDFCKKIAKAPIFTLCGNHDMPDYQKVLGLPYYALILEKFLIVVLNNSIAPFSKENRIFLEKELKKHKEKKFLILFHIPPPNDLYSSSCMKQNEWQALKAILDKYKEKLICLFCAHLHGFQDYYLDGYRIIITGGGGARLSYFQNDTLKSHHAIRINFKDDDSIGFDIIPIE